MIPKKDTDVINFLTERNVSFAISADKTRSLLDTIKSIKELSVFKDLSGLTTDRLTFESVYCLNNTESFRIVSLKWLKKIPSLFEGDKYNYHAIATNLECPLNEVIYNYNKRVNIENHIKP